MNSPDGNSKDLLPLFEAIVKHIPASSGRPGRSPADSGDEPGLQRIPGTHRDRRVFNGTLKRGAEVGISKLDGKLTPTRITKLYTFRGLERDEAQAVPAGDLVAIAGVEGIQIGESITDLANPMPLEPLLIDEAHAGDDFYGKQQPAFWQRGILSHFARPPRSSAKRTSNKRIHPRRGHGHAGIVRVLGRGGIAAGDFDLKPCGAKGLS